MYRLLFLLFIFSLFEINAKEISVLSSEGPPHTIKHQSNNGIDLDIVKAVLNRLNYRVNFHFVPLGRAETLVKAGQFEVMAPIFSATDEAQFFISHPIVKYAPTVFSLRNHKFAPSSLADLNGHSIITFQGAPGYFGSVFAELAKQESYFESPSMEVIPESLYKGRYDYAVLDKYIFYYFYRLTDKQRDLSMFSEHTLIPPVTASAAFKNEKLRDDFNRELVLFLLDGGYQRVVEKYLGEIE